MRQTKIPPAASKLIGTGMAIYEFWCETCKIDYTVERAMDQSSDDSICVICNEKATRKYNITAVFKGPGFYSTDSKPKKAKK